MILMMFLWNIQSWQIVFWAHFWYRGKFIAILSSSVKFPIILTYMENFLENVQILFSCIFMLIVECQTEIKC